MNPDNIPMVSIPRQPADDRGEGDTALTSAQPAPGPLVELELRLHAPLDQVVIVRIAGTIDQVLDLISSADVLIAKLALLPHQARHHSRPGLDHHGVHPTRVQQTGPSLQPGAQGDGSQSGGHAKNPVE